MDGHQLESAAVSLIEDKTAGAPLADILPAMTGEAAAVYEFLAVHSDRTEAEAGAALSLDHTDLVAALHVLRTHRLVRRSHGGKRRWDPVGPECAVAELIVDEETRIQREQAMLLKAREEILGLLPSYLDGLRRRTPSNAIDVVPADPGIVMRVLIQHAQVASTDVCVANPGPEVAPIRWLRPFGSTASAWNGGPTVRLVLDHTTRHDPVARQHVTLLTDQGDQVRTVRRVPSWLVVFDRGTAFVPVGHHQEPEQGIAVVRHHAVVASLYAAFELLWDSAQPFSANGGGNGEAASDELRLEILRHLAAGRKDEVVARRLGLSVRTCRRHIAEVMERLGAESRFQAGVLAEREIFRTRHAATGDY